MDMTKAASTGLHRVRVKLRPSSLPGAEGAYTARTANEAVMSMEDICSALKLRAGFTGHYEDLVSYVQQFLDEAAYHL